MQQKKITAGICVSQAFTVATVDTESIGGTGIVHPSTELALNKFEAIRCPDRPSVRGADSRRALVTTGASPDNRRALVTTVAPAEGMGY